MKAIIQKFEGNQFEIDQLSKNLDAVPDEGKLRELISALKEQQEELIKIQSKIELLQSQKKEIENELDIETLKISKKLKEIAERDNQEDISKRILRNSEKSRATLQKFKEALIDKYINSIEIGITECFKQLLRKANTNHHFRIDKATFKLSVQLDNDEVIPATSLSAGERQILFKESHLFFISDCVSESHEEVWDEPEKRKSRLNLFLIGIGKFYHFLGNFALLRRPASKLPLSSEFL
jgi:DNA sulfur modification protein DndD